MFLPATFNLGVVGTSLGPSFDDTLTFPTIQVFNTEAEFIGSTDAPQYTIVHAKDTDKLYVWDGTRWVVYIQN